MERWFETELLPWLEDRILPVSQPIADRWGIQEGKAKLAGTPMNTADGLIAATALEHEMIVVTRNVKDFEGLGVRIFNPWDGSLKD